MTSDQESGSDRREGLERLLPARLIGPGRRPAWQRTRLRRAVSAGLVAIAAGLAMSAFLPHPTPRGVPIVIVAHDLTAGHVLAQGDLAVADWPTDLRPEGAVADPGALVGRSLGAGMSRGEPITAARLAGPGLLTGAQPGLVAAHVRLTDPAMAAITTPGDHVDLISSAGKLVATDVVVLAVDSSPTGGGTWSATSESRLPGGVTVAVSTSTAASLATTDPSGPSGPSDLTFGLVLRAPTA
ncbi:MAG: Flp pilus assembly protein CpaB [Dermatophilaceae bacterium]|nr:Flp pilus assembly protein CpaB [Dermatophilaceae bacterium]